jgi:hypothetical protein
MGSRRQGRRSSVASPATGSCAGLRPQGRGRSPAGRQPRRDLRPTRQRRRSRLAVAAYANVRARARSGSVRSPHSEEPRKAAASRRMVQLRRRSRSLERPSRCVAYASTPQDEVLRKSFPSKPADASPALCRSVAEHVIGDSDVFHLAIECRAPDAELARHLRHLSAVVREREANDLGFDLLQHAHVAAVIDES